MWVPICAPPKLLYHIHDRFRGPINETKCLLGVYKVKESNGSIFEAIQYMQHPPNANFLLFFAIFHYFTLFTPSPGPPYLTRGFVFMLCIYMHLLVPSPELPSTLRKPQMSLNANFGQKWPDIDAIKGRAQPLLSGFDGPIWPSQKGKESAPERTKGRAELGY